MTMPVLLALAVMGGLVFYVYLRLVDLFFRRRGKRIERRSIARVAVPEGWKLQPNRPIPGRGDCDLYIAAPDGRSWAIEIKSYEGAKKAPFSFFKKRDLVRANGKPFERDPIAQVLAEADALDASPVLWMPKARRKKTFKSKNGVLVIQGDHRRLERAIGARGWFF